MFHKMFYGSVNVSLDSHTQRVDPGIVIVLREVQSCNFCIYLGTIGFMDAFFPDGSVVIYSLPPKAAITQAMPLSKNSGTPTSYNPCPAGATAWIMPRRKASLVT